MHTTRIAATPVQKVLVVNGNTEVLGVLESALDAGRYDMVFVESGDRAYSQIRKVRPDLVILCTCIEHPEGFQLLTMLKLDPDTRDIPVVTYAAECDGDDDAGETSTLGDDDYEELMPVPPAPRMH